MSLACSANPANDKIVIAPGVQIEQARRLVYLLERLPADSQWAHRASGVRGALLRAIQQADGGEVLGETGASQPDLLSVERLNEAGRAILVRAARDMIE